MQAKTVEEQADVGGPPATGRPPTEVVPQARRRRFSASYKARILKEADAVLASGEGLGALLRREGLYRAHLSDWRRAQAAGGLEALEPKRRGPKANPDTAAHHEVARLRRENERLQRELEQATLVVEIQKKLYRLLGLSERSR